MWKKLVLALCAPLLFLVGVEAVVRLLPGSTEGELGDAIADWRTRWEGDFWVAQAGPGINSDGLRDREHAADKAPGVWRVAALGDSVTMGFGLRPRAAYPAVLERLLRERGAAVEVLNVANPGWSIRQQQIAYERIVRRYDVDDVLLGVCLNDVPEMRRRVGETQVPAALVWLHARSRLVRLLVGAEAREMGDVRELFSPQPTRRVEHTWNVFESELLALRDALARDGVRLSLAIFPYRFQLLPDAPAPLPQQRLARGCAEHGLACLDLLEALRPLGADAFIDENHLSASGARETAGALLRWGRFQPPETAAPARS